jgi:diguanylate cyclase (GGDEF)-like protein/PAS domain S-box-containing protein
MSFIGKLQKIPTFWMGTIRSQLVWAFSCVSLLIMLGLAGFLYEKQRQFLYKTALQQSVSLATTLASSSISWVLTNDVAGLKELLQGFSSITDLKRAYILSLSGEILSSTQTKEIGLFVIDNQSQKLLSSPPRPQVLLANSQQIDVAVPVLSGTRHVGWARVEMTLNAVKSNLFSIVIIGISFILLAVLIITITARLLAMGLTKRLHHLMQVADKVGQGQLDMRAQLNSVDEVGVLAKFFNQMLDKLSASERQREQINKLYAAWTESVDVIVRESDEHKLFAEVCRIIAKHVDFKLIWIGMLNADGSVRVEATSNPESAYLREVQKTTDQLIPEKMGAVLQAIHKQTAVIFNNFLNQVAIESWHNNAEAEGILAAAAFPLMRGGHCVGAIGVYSGEENYFTAELITLVGGLADDLSYALDNLDREQRRLEVEQELRIAAAAFESQEGIFVTDANRRILRVNRAFTELTGYSAEDVIGKKPMLLKSEKQTKEFYTTIWQNIMENKSWQGELWNHRKNGQLFPQWLSISAISNDEGQITHYVCSFADISQHKENEEKIRYLAFYDSLTKLPNRTLLFERLASAFNTSRRNKSHGALMFLDLDNFKTLNDTLGHDLGDQLLIEVAARLQNCIRDTDTVARLGGDEFVIMLEGLSHLTEEATLQAQKLAEKIRKILADPYLLLLKSGTKNQSTIEYYSSGSIGFALFFGHQSSTEELLKRVDLAMYQAKQAGRNAIRAFIPEMQTALNIRTALENELRNALARNEIKLYYQIQVDKNCKPVAAEVLVRWHQSERGIVFPDQFIPLAEETGLIVPIGLWILNRSCETLKQWTQDPNTSLLRLAVNISSRQLSQADFVEQVKEILQRTGVNPALLKLEVTESMVLDNIDEAIKKMSAIRALGVDFSMDDFGTGYSSLSYIQKLPLEQLKIDKSFVKNLPINKGDAAITRTILALGQSLGLNVVAEGVETQEQLDYLRSVGCGLFQGYLFGKPIAEDEFKTLLSEKRFEQSN